mmetsp:Transcript_51090/g.95697  ORF Transcript_51090/g.95697 Transcript_51090/m.95697 type:complete len:154 (-) Transcript_51090:241-702(-)
MTVDVSVPEQCMEFTRLCEKENALQRHWVFAELKPSELALAKQGQVKELSYHLLMKNATAASLMPQPLETREAAALRAAGEAAVRREKVEAAVQTRVAEETAELKQQIATEAAHRRRIFSELRSIPHVQPPVRPVRAAVRTTFRSKSETKLLR